MCIKKRKPKPLGNDWAENYSLLYSVCTNIEDWLQITWKHHLLLFLVVTMIFHLNDVALVSIKHI